MRDTRVGLLRSVVTAGPTTAFALTMGISQSHVTTEAVVPQANVQLRNELAGVLQFHGEHLGGRPCVHCFQPGSYAMSPRDYRRGLGRLDQVEM